MTPSPSGRWTPFDVLARAHYIALTTFRRDGTPVSTPVWLAPDGGHLYVLTGAESGKAKRLRHNNSVEVAPSDGRGKPHGPSVPGTARLLTSEDDLARVLALIKARYGWQYRGIGVIHRISNAIRRTGDAPSVALEITLT